MNPRYPCGYAIFPRSCTRPLCDPSSCNIIPDYCFQSILKKEKCTCNICTVIDLSKITGFEWDKGNIDKSYQKHGITPNEAEEVFLDEDILLLEDIKHSKQEERFEAIGKTIKGNILFLIFTTRKNRIRIISSRRANKKERRLYEKT